MNPAPAALLQTAREAALALRISERKLWQLTKTGEIPHLRIGRAVRYAIVDLEVWIETQKQKAGK